jgi:hypothetical protein
MLHSEADIILSSVIQELPPAPEPDDNAAEVVYTRPPPQRIPLAHLALGIFRDRASTSQAELRQLREVFQAMIQASNIQEDSLRGLPEKVDTVVRHVRGLMPILCLWRKPITVAYQKQATLPETDKGKPSKIKHVGKAWHYWYDIKEMITSILSATALKNKMYFGYAQYVDHPREFWHSRAWGSSALATSGQFVISEAGDTILPGNFISLVTDVEGFTSGRVIFVGEDHRSASPQRGQVLLTIQPVVKKTALPNEFPHVDVHRLELLLLDKAIEVHEDNVKERLDITMDWEYDPGDARTHEPKHLTRFFIGKLINYDKQSTTTVRFTHPTRADLEVEAYGRENIEGFKNRSGHLRSLSLPYILYVDEFGAHRNTHRSLRAFYLSPARLDYKERRQVSNQFTMTMGPHGADIEDIVKHMAPEVESMAEEGTMVDLEDDETYIVRAFPIVLTGDMPQNADNAGFMRHQAQKGCRAAILHKKSDATWIMISPAMGDITTIRCSYERKVGLCLLKKHELSSSKT